MVKIDQDRYQQLINSEEFTLLYRHLSHSNLRFQELPEKEKKIALAITMMGDEDIVTGLRETMFYRPIPTIDEMLNDRKYLGSVGQTIFSYWKEQLHKLFDPSLNYYEGVYNGAIGVGKSSIARLSLLLNLIRLTCLKYPQLTLGQSEDYSNDVY